MPKKNKSLPVKLIANPCAGNPSDSAKNLKLIIGYLNRNGLKVDVALAKSHGKVTRIARRAIKDGYKIILAMGGDGTIKATMRGLIYSKARLGIIPVGIENNIAKSIDIPQNLEEACASIISNEVLKLDVGQVKTRKGKKFIFIEMATIGLSVASYRAVNKIGNGKITKIKDIALTLIQQETRPKVFLTLNDEKQLEVETMSVMVSNTPVFGKDIKVAPEVSLQDGLLDISVYPEFSKDELLGYYAAMLNGGYSGDRKVQRYQARKLKIKASPKQEVMVDGVALGRGTVTIKVRPGAIRVITPLNSQVSEIPLEDTTGKLSEVVSSKIGNSH